MRISLVVGSLLLCGSVSVRAQDACVRYLHQKVQVISPAAALARYRNLPVKSEFETSAQYRTRVDATVPSGPLIIRRYARNDLYLEYDADAGKLAVYHGLFGDPRPDAWSMLSRAGHFDELKPSVSDNVAAVLEEREITVGAYIGQNAFGATTRVTRIKRISTDVFDRAGTLLPIAPTYNPSLLGEIPMSAADAKRLKPQLRAALAVRPRPPYLIRGSRIAELPSLDRPKKVSEDYSLLIADIDCGLLVQPDGTVVASYKARGGN